MIQRLQSLFLLLTGGCLGGSLVVPFADTDAPVPETVFADAIYTASDGIPLLVAFGLGAALAIGAIFLYRNRGLQQKLVLALLALVGGGIGFAVGQVMKQAERIGDAVVIDDEPGMFLPLAALILGGLAYRYIRADERLVRSADRLR